MRLRGKQGFEEPGAVVDLSDVADLLECSNAFPHDRDLPWAVENFLDSDRRGGTGVDDALVIANGREGATFVKDAPVLFYNRYQCLSILG